MNNRLSTTLPYIFLVFLIVGGLTVFSIYLGMGSHMAALLSSASIEKIQAGCEATMCRGFLSLFPLISNTLVRLVPFVWFIVLSIIAYGGFIMWRLMRDGQVRPSFTLTPFKIVLLFVLCVWLIFTSLSIGKIGNASVRRIVEVRADVYQNVGEEGIQRLQENFNNLNQAGCLTLEGQLTNGANSYLVKSRCIQASFFTRVLPPLFFALLFLFEFLVLGKFILGLTKLRSSSRFTDAALSMGYGICGWIVILWTAAIIGKFYVPTFAWILLAAVPIIFFKQTFYWLRVFFTETWTVERKWYSPVLLIGWLLFAYLALNFITVIRPFPIGWDDLGSYMNRPRLLVDFGHFIYSMASFQWEYITSLGFLIFGTQSPLGTSIALVTNWTAGLLSVLAVYLFGKRFLGEKHGLVAALLYYTLPLVGHFSYADMKIDNAVFTMGVLATFALFSYLFPKHNEEGEEEPAHDYRWLIAAGVFVGFAFGMKATAIMLAIALGAVLFSNKFHWTSFVGAIFLACALFVYRGVLHFDTLVERIFGNPDVLSSTAFTVSATILGLGFIAYGFRNNASRFKSAFLSSAIFAGAFLITLVPWIGHNYYLFEGNTSLLALGAPNTVTPVLQIGEKAPDVSPRQKIIALPKELQVDQTADVCQPTGHKEELDRYWGGEKGIAHYLTLPWRTVMNSDSTGYYVTTTPILLLFPLLLLLPLLWAKKNRALRWLSFATFFLIFEWAFLANGIPWYGIAIFLGLAIGTEALYAFAPDRLTKWIVGILIGLSILMNFGQRLWQFDQQRNLYEYQMGKITKEALIERTIPHYDDIADIVTQRYKTMPDRPYLYRVGTFIPYFIPRSLEVIAAVDHQLDLFNCLYQERDPALTVQRLKALGINSIIFDTNTATIEKNAQGTLHQKVNTFVNFVNNPAAELEVVIQDAGAGVAFLLIP